MPVPYIKKIKTVNRKYFERYGINPSSLGLSQRNYIDKLISILIVCAEDPLYCHLCERTVLDFMKVTEGMTWRDVSTVFMSVQNQIEADWESYVKKRKEYIFILHPRLLSRLRNEDYY